MSDIAIDPWRKYLIQLQVEPIKTKSVTAGVLSGLVDAIAQKISGIKRLQLKRLLLIMLFGFAYRGLSGHYFHKLMDAIFKGRNDNKTVAKKVMLEQLNISPWNNFFFMVFYGLVIEGRSWKLVNNKIRKDYPSVQLASWRFWPIIGWMNYRCIPIQLRVLFQSIVGICWAIFLSLKARSATIKKD